MRAINISFIFTLIFAFLGIALFAAISLFLYNHFIALNAVSSMVANVNIQHLYQEYQRCASTHGHENCKYILNMIREPIKFNILTDIRFWVILAILLLIVSMVVYVTKRE